MKGWTCSKNKLEIMADTEIYFNHKIFKSKKEALKYYYPFTDKDEIKKVKIIISNEK
jgi:hypothetical protein